MQAVAVPNGRQVFSLTVPPNAEVAFTEDPNSILVRANHRLLLGGVGQDTLRELFSDSRPIAGFHRAAHQILSWSAEGEAVIRPLHGDGAVVRFAVARAPLLFTQDGSRVMSYGASAPAGVGVTFWESRTGRCLGVVPVQPEATLTTSVDENGEAFAALGTNHSTVLLGRCSHPADAREIDLHGDAPVSLLLAPGRDHPLHLAFRLLCRGLWHTRRTGRKSGTRRFGPSTVRFSPNKLPPRHLGRRKFHPAPGPAHGR